MIRPATVQSCNTHSCQETRCDKNNFYHSHRTDSETQSFFSREVYWDGELLLSCAGSTGIACDSGWNIKNGYQYNPGEAVSSCGTGSYQSTCTFSGRCNTGINSHVCYDYCVIRIPV